jgi:hypothetical protein
MVRIAAGGCGRSIAPSMQAFWPRDSQRGDTRDCNGKEGVAGSSPAEGFTEPRCGAVFSFPERLR